MQKKKREELKEIIHINFNQKVNISIMSILPITYHDWSTGRPFFIDH